MHRLAPDVGRRLRRLLGDRRRTRSHRRRHARRAAAASGGERVDGRPHGAGRRPRHADGRLREHDQRYRYTVAWIDILARGAAFGRGVITSGDHAAAGPSRSTASRTRSHTCRVRGSRRRRCPSARSARDRAPLRRALVREGAGHAARRPGAAGGLLPSARRGPAVEPVLRAARLPAVPVRRPGRPRRTSSSAPCTSVAAAGPAFLGVLKRFGAAEAAPLSFPRPGWTLAVDMPAPRRDAGRLVRTLDRLDDGVAACRRRGLSGQGRADAART